MSTPPGLAAHRPSSSQRLEALLQRMQGAESQGPEIYTRLYTVEARAAAQAADARWREGRPLSALDGAIVSLKASIDVQGWVTTAGSPKLATQPPAAADATLVRRLRQAGAVILGSVQMTELAFSGLGLNPHEKCLRNPTDLFRVTGGSSSGSAASVAAGLAELSIGGDTGGSIRIPAALCGVVGFKPTHGRVPAQGVFPLSTTLDCNGPIGPDVHRCAQAYAVLAGTPAPALQDGAAPPRLTPITGVPLLGLDPAVGRAYENALARLSGYGVLGPAMDLDALFAAMAEMDRTGVFTVPELLTTLQAHGVESLDGLHPMVHQRLQAYADMRATDYVRVTRQREALMAAMDAQLQHGEILLMPTVPILAPRIADLTTVEAQLQAAARVVRNTRLANLCDLPSISLPLRCAEGRVGLMLTARQGADEHLLKAAAHVERLLHDA